MAQGLLTGVRRAWFSPVLSNPLCFFRKYFMVFSESDSFTKKIYDVITDDEYSQLQWALVNNPESGSLIPSSGGIRKIRWAVQGRGKRGGARVIYYWVTENDEILFLDIYRKTEKDDLTKREIDFFKQLVKEYLRDE